MKNVTAKIFGTLLSLVLLAIPHTSRVNAQCTGICIGNPLGDATLWTILERILDGLILLAIPIVILSIIYAGFLFVSAQGNTEKLEKAKRAILYSLLGALILLGAQAISVLIGNTIKSLNP